MKCPSRPVLDVHKNVYIIVYMTAYNTSNTWGQTYRMYTTYILRVHMYAYTYTKHTHAWCCICTCTHKHILQCTQATMKIHHITIIVIAMVQSITLSCYGKQTAVIYSHWNIQFMGFLQIWECCNVKIHEHIATY